MLAAAFVLLAVTHAAALNPPPPYFESGVQDEQGTVWAYSRAEYNQVFSFNGSEWASHSGPFHSGQSAMPAALARLKDGPVACVWRLEPHSVGVTSQSPAGVTLMGVCAGEIPGSGLTVAPFCDSKNRIWITGDFPQIYRADRRGVKMVYKISAEDYANPNPKPEGYNKVFAVEDGRGRVWAWSDPSASNYASLRGVLIFAGDTPELHAAFGAVSGKKILAIARADDRHMWISVADDGIYRVDIDAFTIQREPDPMPKAFCCVHELHVTRQDVFAIEDYPVFQHRLWRRHSGVWTNLAEQFDHKPYSFLPRSWLELAQGYLVEGYGTGPWYIPKSAGGFATEVGWKAGFPLHDVVGLSRFKDGKIFCLAEFKIFYDHLELPPRPKSNSRLVWVAAQRGWKKDSEGRIWAILKDTPRMLSQWDGDQWIGHEMPIAYPEGQMPTMQGDLRGQMWIEAASRDGVVQIYDPAADHWQTYKNLEAAYVALGHQPPQFISNGSLDYEGPVYSPDLKRVAYRLGAAYIYYYDGAKWRHFDRLQITAKNEDNAVGPPAFDRTGTLFVNMRPHSSYQMDTSDKWTPTTYRSLYPLDMWSENGSGQSQVNPSRLPAPFGAVTHTPDWCVRDNLGTYWLTWKGQLYRAIPGRCVAQFAPGEVNPFFSNPGLNQVYVDKNGNALFTGSSEVDPFVMLRPKTPPPRTAINLRRTAPDSFEARLTCQTTRAVTFRWQFDRESGRDQSNPVIPLSHLPSGLHTLRVTAMDADLNMQADPTVATFTVQIDSSAQIAELVAQLGRCLLRQARGGCRCLGPPACLGHSRASEGARRCDGTGAMVD